MNMRQIEGFCLLAKTLNFSKAAEKMYITQPAFSRMIESLENELGCKLIVRDRVKPKLTPAGERMLWHMEQIMRQYDALIELSRAQNSQGGEITIGVMEAGLTDSARDILRRYSAEYPAMHVNFREVSEIEVFDLLLAGKLDCAIVAHFPELYRGALDGQIIEKYRICAVLNREHPLAGRAMISVKELKEEPFVIVDAEKSALGYRAVTSLCLKNGFSPRIARKEGSVAMALSAVDLNYGCMILIDSLREMAGRNTVFVPLEGVEEGQIWLVKNRGGSNAAMENFMVFLNAISYHAEGRFPCNGHVLWLCGWQQRRRRHLIRSLSGGVKRRPDGTPPAFLSSESRPISMKIGLLESPVPQTVGSAVCGSNQ